MLFPVCTGLYQWNVYLNIAFIDLRYPSCLTLCRPIPIFLQSPWPCMYVHAQETEMLPYSWVSPTVPVNEPSITRLVVKYQGKKFIVSAASIKCTQTYSHTYVRTITSHIITPHCTQVLVPSDATFKDAKSEISRVYRGIYKSPEEEP